MFTEKIVNIKAASLGNLQELQRTSDFYFFMEIYFLIDKQCKTQLKPFRHQIRSGCYDVRPFI